jgi:hypothetical protein
MLCYRFSHLTSPNDIHFVFKWWCQHIKKYFRDEHKLIGKFGTASIGKNEFAEDDSDDAIYGFSDVPFIAPSVIFYKKNNYDIYNTDHHGGR